MVTFYFHGNLPGLLPQKFSQQKVICHFLKRKTTVKDMVESFGIPHPEVERIVVCGIPVGFDYIVNKDDTVEIFPLSTESNFSVPSLLRSEPLKEFRFVVDINVAKLVSKLRMLGFDTTFNRSFTDNELAAVSSCQRRILLSRDRNLLKRKSVMFGHLIRSTCPQNQFLEVVEIFRLKNRIRPFTLCIHCNGKLFPVNKDDIVDLLEPLTKKYFSSFTRCISCGKIYWPGSHRSKMEKELRKLLG